MSVRLCPFCAEQIQTEARKCKHCGEFLDVTKQDATPVAAGAQKTLREGTPVALAFAQDVDSDRAIVGERINLNLVRELRDGEWRIARLMSPAVGTVTSVKGSGRMGR